MPPKLVAIQGSPRPHGNSRALLDAMVEGARTAHEGLEVHILEAYALNVGPCTACGACEGEGEGCALEGDEWPQVEALLRSADALVVASPVYFSGLPAPLKAIVDRLQAMWVLRDRGGRVARNAGPRRRAAIILASSQHGMSKGALGEARAAVRTLEFEIAGELLAGGLEGPTEASARPELLESARDLGRQLVAP